VTGNRKTKKGQALNKEELEKQRKEKALFKATLKREGKQTNSDSEEDEDNWESAEEDFPHVKLEELLDNLKIEGSDEEN